MDQRMLSAVLAVHLMWTSKSNTSNKASVHSADVIAACEWLHKDSNNVKSFLQFCFCQNESLNWYLFIPWPQISFHSPELLLTLQWLISLTVIFSQSTLTNVFYLFPRTAQHEFPGGEMAKSLHGWSTLPQPTALGCYFRKITETGAQQQAEKQTISSGISKGIKQ